MNNLAKQVVRLLKYILCWLIDQLYLVPSQCIHASPVVPAHPSGCSRCPQDPGNKGKMAGVTRNLLDPDLPLWPASALIGKSWYHTVVKCY